MNLPPAHQNREVGLTLWMLGWLSGLPLLAMSHDEPSWPLAALVSLALLVSGVCLVRRSGAAAVERVRRDGS